MKEMEYRFFTPFDRLSTVETDEVTDFLYEHLVQYGDDRQHIKKAIAYAMKEIPSQGGFVLMCTKNNEIIGVVVINKTGMGGYIPENILVYIAVHKDMTGQGLGRSLMEKAIRFSEGDIALHVEPDNPARFLYEKMGFDNKYLEMRLKKNDDRNSQSPQAKEDLTRHELRSEIEKNINR